MTAKALAGVAALAFAASASARDAHEAPACRAAQLAIRAGPQISPGTGQHPLALRIVNRGSHACVLFGYPRLAFTDARGVIPFAIRRGGDQMIAARRPTRVVVGPRRAAFVVVNKYRCDLGNRRTARRVRVRLPRDARALALAVPRHVAIAYCGRGDPGSTITTSPFVATLRAARRR